MKRVVELEFGDADEPLFVTYDQEALIRAAGEAAPTGILGGLYGETSATFETLVEAIVSWNLVDKGRPYPLDRESLSHLPIYVLYQVSRAIWSDAFERDN
jgi:hypothetical protein